MINTNDILETISMIEEENLDIRTITMGISLYDCIDSDSDICATKVYDKIMKLAKDLVKTGQNLETEYGIPIINKRIAVTPISLISASCKDPVKIAKALDKAAHELSVNFIGGYTALCAKGETEADTALIESIPEVLASTNNLCSSVNIGSTKAGINMDVVKKMGKVILDTAKKTADKECIGAAKLVVFCNAVEDNPFMAGAFLGVNEAESVLSLGVSGPGVVRAALAKADKSLPLNEISELIKRTAFKITRVGELILSEACKRLHMRRGIIDLSLAPTPAVGDSVADIIEEIGIKTCGGYGTVAALALLNDAVKKGGVMGTSSAGGLSGAFIPVSEDRGMINAVSRGALSMDKLLCMTSVCSVGLDMVIIPGDTSKDVISALIADEAAIGMINQKTTAVRVIPAIGKKSGETLNFGGLLGFGPIMKVLDTPATSPSVFVNRGGFIPAPIHSLKN